MKLKLDGGTVLAINRVLSVPDSKLKLVSINLTTKGTQHDVVFGKDDCLLTDPLQALVQRSTRLQ